MKSIKQFLTLSLDRAVFIATGLGLIMGYYSTPLTLKLASGCAQVFINLLQLISLPIIFFSIVATLANMQDMQEMHHIGRKFLGYTLLTTIIAALVALGLYKLINPVALITGGVDVAGSLPGVQHSYLQFILDIIPSNAFKALTDNHKVMSVVFMAVGLGIAILSLPDHEKAPLQNFFRSFFSAILQITKAVMYATPLGIWAFMVLLVQELHGSLAQLEIIGWYIVCVIAANLIQGFIILPLFLKFKGLSPLKVMRGMLPALVTAFFSKSSNATLPFSMQCAQNNLGISQKVSSIGFPLCAVINMNGCAAFIFLTVLFVATQAGLAFTLFDQLVWVLIATIAAVGNAGVPMGCFFLSTALLTGMGVPVGTMMIILPLYTVIDMIETTVNVWSDSCIVAVVDQEVTV